jgi:hypothetical protein
MGIWLRYGDLDLGVILSPCGRERKLGRWQNVEVVLGGSLGLPASEDHADQQLVLQYV